MIMSCHIPVSGNLREKTIAADSVSFNPSFEKCYYKTTEIKTYLRKNKSFKWCN